jgi:phosphate starvation-inducible PhoH-like protein
MKIRRLHFKGNYSDSLAFMRGRTLDNAFVILDEAQNTTHSQMKMFLTRMGKSAKFMITGDPGQVDLPRRTISD